MKKALSNSKLSTTSKLVRRVLSRTSTASRSSHEDASKPQIEPQASEAMKTKRGGGRIEPQTSTTTSDSLRTRRGAESLEVELSGLREQVSILQLTISSMQEDSEKREKALASLIKEKQQLGSELKREKRSTINLKQQLSDEREFYYKEKEQYCQEMNDCKKLKKKMSESIKKRASKEESLESIKHKNEISKLKEALNHTLEANYNLCVKFLRMKNTKVSLKNRLKKQINDNELVLKEIQTKVDSLKNEIADIVDKRFQFPISPSSKRYLQIVKENGKLLHENLSLQMQADRLTNEIYDFQYIMQRNESNKQLKYIRSTQTQTNETNRTSERTEEPSSSKQTVSQKVSSDKESEPKSKSEKHIPKQKPPKKEKSSTSRRSSEEQTKSKRNLTSRRSSTKKDSMEKPSPHKRSTETSSNQEKKKIVSKKSETTVSEVIKIFERKRVEGVPHIIMLSEVKEQNTYQKQKSKNEKTDNDKKVQNDCMAKEVLRDSQQELQMILPLIGQKPSLVATDISDVTQSTSDDIAIRIQSAPSIVQKSTFVSSKDKH